MTAPFAHPRKGNAAVEFELHCQVAQLLEQFCLPTWRYTHIPLGELRNPITGARLKRMGVTKGWPDFAGRPVRICFLELKRGKGKPTPEQSEIATHLMQSGRVTPLHSRSRAPSSMLKVGDATRGMFTCSEAP